VSPVHHPTDDLLLGHASGSPDEGAELVVATHLALCPTCRRQVAVWEEVGGAYLDALEPVPGPALDARALAEAVREAAPEPPAAPIHRDRDRDRDLDRDRPVLPEPLRTLAGGDVGELSWRWRGPGVREVTLPVPSPGPAVRIARLAPWITFPMHADRDRELTLVLSGGLRDAFGTFERGDLSIRDASHRHEQRVLPGEPCICLVVNADRLVPLTWLGRILARFTDV
jgi:putative transcriptional regulator